MKKRILLTDTVNLNKRNFPTLFSAIENKARFEVHTLEVENELLSAYGNYHKNREITSIKKNIRKLEIEELISLEERRVNILDICEAEFLTLITSKKNFSGSILSKSKKERLAYYIENYRNDLLINLAAGIYWVRRWSSELNLLPFLHYSVVFSGSSIYTKSFMALIKRTQCRNFVVESSFTGNDFYFEEKYDHIANNSDIKFPAIFKKALADHVEDTIDRQRENIKGINKFRMMANKNVTQPTDSASLPLNDNSTFLLICQVVNDYSVIEEKISTIEFYKNVLQELSSYECNVVVKLHPWEHKKTNIKSAYTKNVLEEFTDNHLGQSNATFFFVEDYNLKALFDASDYVIGLNSQSLIEAAYHGHKPLQFGNAFYGNKGFTHDFHISQLCDVFKEAFEGGIRDTLTLDEWEKYMDFLSIYTCKQLVSVNKSGVGKIKERLSDYVHIELVKVQQPITKIVKEVDPKNELSVFHRKMRKFKRDPYGFFKDSNIPIARPVRQLFR